MAVCVLLVALVHSFEHSRKRESSSTRSSGGSKAGKEEARGSPDASSDYREIRSSDEPTVEEATFIYTLEHAFTPDQWSERGR